MILGRAPFGKTAPFSGPQAIVFSTRAKGPRADSAVLQLRGPQRLRCFNPDGGARPTRGPPATTLFAGRQCLDRVARRRPHSPMAGRWAALTAARGAVCGSSGPATASTRGPAVALTEAEALRILSPALATGTLRGTDGHLGILIPPSIACLIVYAIIVEGAKRRNPLCRSADPGACWPSCSLSPQPSPTTSGWYRTPPQGRAGARAMLLAAHARRFVAGARHLRLVIGGASTPACTIPTAPGRRHRRVLVDLYGRKWGRRRAALRWRDTVGNLLEDGRARAA